MIFGDEAVGVIRLDEVMRVGPLWWNQCPYKKRHQRSCSLCISALWEHSEKVTNHKPGRESSPNPTMRVLWSQTYSLQNCEKINACCLSHLICVYFNGRSNRPIQHMCTYVHDQVSTEGDAEWPETSTRTSVSYGTNILRSSYDSVVYISTHWNFRKCSSKYMISEGP